VNTIRTLEAELYQGSVAPFCAQKNFFGSLDRTNTGGLDYAILQRLSTRWLARASFVLLFVAVLLVGAGILFGLLKAT
jgi:hypothetical protein